MTKYLDLTLYGHPVLRKKAQEVTNFGADFQELVQAMLDGLVTYSGVGLAAPQVGKSLSLCVINLDIDEMKASRLKNGHFYADWDGRRVPLEVLMPLILVNPKPVDFLGRLCFFEEGCLSFPDFGHHGVHRPEGIILNYQDRNGQVHKLGVAGMLSRVIQHEIDHLVGILHIDRMEEDVIRKQKNRLRALKTAYAKQNFIQRHPLNQTS